MEGVNIDHSTGTLKAVLIRCCNTDQLQN